MKASTFFLGLATGLVAGAATTLFSTPQSGHDFRTSVKTSSSDWKEKLTDIKEKVNNLKESVNHLKEQTKVAVPEAADGLKASLETWKESTGPAKEHLQLEILAIQNAIEALQSSISKEQTKSHDNSKDDSNNK